MNDDFMKGMQAYEGESKWRDVTFSVIFTHPDHAHLNAHTIAFEAIDWYDAASRIVQVGYSNINLEEFKEAMLLGKDFIDPISGNIFRPK